MVPSALGLSAEQTRTALLAAAAAPSPHNTQPWRFRLADDHIELWADLTRRLPVADPDNRELRIACGAALFNLCLALQVLHVRPSIRPVPDRSQPCLLAAVHSDGPHEPTPRQRELLRAVGHRHTNRRPFTDEPVDPARRHALQSAAAAQGAVLRLLDAGDGRYPELLGLARQAHDQQMSDPEFRAELAAWIPDRPVDVDLPRRPDPWVLRPYPDVGPVPRDPSADPRPLIGVLAAHLTGPHGDLSSGQALQHVLLAATLEGLQTSPVSQLIEVASVRDRVQRLLGLATPPAAVLRLGRGDLIGPTRRRPLEDLLVR